MRGRVDDAELHKGALEGHGIATGGACGSRGESGAAMRRVPHDAGAVRHELAERDEAISRRYAEVGQHARGVVRGGEEARGRHAKPAQHGVADALWRGRQQDLPDLRDYGGARHGRQKHGCADNAQMPRRAFQRERQEEQRRP